jgi:rod shape-determining protein MreD
MRNAALLAIGMALLLVQGNLFRFLGAIQIQGVTPNLVLPLIIFLGVHEGSMARGALLSFALGYATDLFASAPIGLLTFTTMATWWLSRVAAVRLSAQTIPTQMFLALMFALFESAIVLTLLTIFGVDPQRPVEISSVVLPHAIVTSLCSPPIFKLVQRVQHGAGSTARRAERGIG